ncbi:metal-sulfur cluster assembly factor [Pediococcus siamensis]|uniref:metal-sulfur cluster assembly factor n=1 Tax=Pediococcus siamensis TaxID=381829 RepID=UPI0039A0CBD2
MTTTDRNFETQAFKALSQVIDPEIGVDLVSLGLIYGVTCTQGLCTVTMTLTMMGCPLTDVLNQAITNSLQALPDVDQVKINLVWEPVWTIAKMSREARVQLGLF